MAALLARIARADATATAIAGRARLLAGVKDLLT
jgi:hypothetical protein